MIGTVLACECENAADATVNEHGRRYTVRVVGAGWLLSLQHRTEPVTPGNRVLVQQADGEDAGAYLAGRLVVTEVPS